MADRGQMADTEKSTSVDSQQGGDKMVARAISRFVKVPPRKVARLARRCLGRPVDEVIGQLRMHPQKAARFLSKVILSAGANLKQKLPADQTEVEIAIKSLSVDQGPSYKRVIYRARGRADRKTVLSSHITVVVEADTAVGDAKSAA